VSSHIVTEVEKMLPLLQIVAGKHPIKFQEFDYGHACGVAVGKFGAVRVLNKSVIVPRAGVMGLIERQWILRKLGLVSYRRRRIDPDEVKLEILTFIRHKTKGVGDDEVQLGNEP
jgi:hypothetical protein